MENITFLAIESVECFFRKLLECKVACPEMHPKLYDEKLLSNMIKERVTSTELLQEIMQRLDQPGPFSNLFAKERRALQDELLKRVTPYTGVSPRR